MGPGPDRLNEATMARCARGIVDAVSSAQDGLRTRGLVLGFDGRRGSARFADVFAKVASAGGVPVLRFERPVPTPLVSFAVRRGGHELGIMITASHNPPDYNGMKVFGPEGAQVAPPLDGMIEAAIDAAPPADEIPRGTGVGVSLDLDEVYLDALGAARSTSGPLGVRVAYSAMHGVGASLFTRLMTRHGVELTSVASQAEPDGAFPTVTSPNPEDESALTEVRDLAEARAIDLALAHDPDADRLAVIVRHEGRQVVLTGDEIGVLLADHLLTRVEPSSAVLLTTVVSSRRIERLARKRGAKCLRTPTGFKWMARAAAELEPPSRVVLAYEQALGFSVHDVVRDKDALGAGLAVVEVFAEQRRRGRTLLDRLAELDEELGAHRTAAITQTWPPEAREEVEAAFEAVRGGGALEVEGLGVGALADDTPGVPLVRQSFSDGSWFGVRPSGTEPKLKVYLEAWAPPGPRSAEQAERKLAALRAAVTARLEARR